MAMQCTSPPPHIVSLVHGHHPLSGCCPNPMAMVGGSSPSPHLMHERGFSCPWLGHWVLGFDQLNMWFAFLQVHQCTIAQETIHRISFGILVCSCSKRLGLI